MNEVVLLTLIGLTLGLEGLKRIPTYRRLPYIAYAIQTLLFRLPPEFL